MIANRELRLEDYLAIGRRQLVFVLVPAILGPLLGLLVSFTFLPRYTSYSMLLVEPQVVPTGYVKPIISERVRDRIITLQQKVLSRSRLEPSVRRLGLVRNGKSEDEVIDHIRTHVHIHEADPFGPPPSSGGPPPNRVVSDVDASGFYVEYTDFDPLDAQQICAEVTSMLLAENLEMRQQAAQSTTDFISRQLEQSKQNLDVIDQKLAEFKKLHLGQLPSDQENNLKILMGLTAQLDANTQGVSRLQQDKAYAEAMLDKETAAVKSLEANPNVPTLRERVLTLQNQLIEMRTRYTEDHPDIAKTERDIDELKQGIKDMNADPDPDAVPEGLRAKMDPPQIRQLKEQIRQNDLAVDRAMLRQKRLQEAIDTYQARISVSPEIEEQYKQLTRDNETAHGIYNGLLANESSAKMQTEMERKQQGEQVRLVDPAILPRAPSFPVRTKFAAVGLAVGFGLGLCFGFWRELRDGAMRNEGDVLAALELPMLATVPWLGTKKDSSRRPRFGKHPTTLAGEGGPSEL
jgi:uncharacterized protein involved in exopolysaccharide biosynthesis